MRVFISWSGQQSNHIAVALREWLPRVLQHIEPFVSSEDIRKGSRWLVELGKQLESADYGIICVTPDNLAAPWLNFEAGALAKYFDESEVTPLLFGLEPAEVDTPINQFQCTAYSEEDMRRLVHTLNDSGAQRRIDTAHLNDTFKMWWPSLDSRLGPIIKAARAIHSEEEIEENVAGIRAALDEIASAVNRQSTLLQSPESMLPRDYLSSVIRRVPLVITRADIDLDDYVKLANGWRTLAATIESHPVEFISCRKVRDLLDELRAPMQKFAAILQPDRLIAEEQLPRISFDDLPPDDEEDAGSAMRRKVGV